MENIEQFRLKERRQSHDTIIFIQPQFILVLQKQVKITRKKTIANNILLMILTGKWICLNAIYFM